MSLQKIGIPMAMRARIDKEKNKSEEKKSFVLFVGLQQLLFLLVELVNVFHTEGMLRVVPINQNDITNIIRHNFMIIVMIITRLL